MNTDKNYCEVQHKLTERNILRVQCDRGSKSVTIQQTLIDDGEPYIWENQYIELTMEGAYKLIDLMKTAMEVKL